MTMQSFDELYPGRFLKAGLFNGQPVTYTVKDVEQEMLDGEKGPEPKVVMAFEETPLLLVLAKVNAVAIRQMFGAVVPEWIGKRITFYGTTAILPYPKRKNEPCIRVYGSPDITEEIRCEWKPPKKGIVVQVLKPTASELFGKVKAAIEAAATAEALGKIMDRVSELASSGSLTKGEHDALSAMAAGIAFAEADELSAAAKAEAMDFANSLPLGKQKLLLAAMIDEFALPSANQVSLAAAITTPAQAVFALNYK